MSKTGKILLILVVIALLIGVAWRVVHGATAVLSWTTPYDPKAGGKGVRVSAYDLRYSTDSVGFFANPATGTPFTPMPVPLDSGLTGTVTVSGLADDSRYWFALRSVDAAGNWSAWSNIPVKVTPDLTAPLKILDLR